MFSVEESVRRNGAVMKILGSLSKGASFGVVVEGAEKVLVSHEKGDISFSKLGESEKPDFVVTMQEDVFAKLFSDYSATLNAGDFLVFAAKLLSDEKEKINLVIYANFLKLTLHGYLKVLPLGGTAFLKVLKEHGLGSVFAIEKKLAAFKNK